MITEELKRTILGALKLEDWEISSESLASEVPGWDSLAHVNVITAVENRFGVRFKTREVLGLKTVGDLQELVNTKLQKK
jgi:acyl carrier protein